MKKDLKDRKLILNTETLKSLRSKTGIQAGRPLRTNFTPCPCTP
jgi:hypothetical protein